MSKLSKGFVSQPSSYYLPSSPPPLRSGARPPADLRSSERVSLYRVAGPLRRQPCASASAPAAATSLVSTRASRPSSTGSATAGTRSSGIRRGWAGLLETNLDDPATISANTVALDPAAVRTIDRNGGTVLHTSRTNPGRVKTSSLPRSSPTRPWATVPHDFTKHAISVLEHLGIDALIPIGGDDTLSYGLRLHDEGVPVIAIPKTMDNDVHGTDYCIGFSTAVTRRRVHPRAADVHGLARADRRRRAVRPVQR